jgi:hypothetical protein
VFCLADEFIVFYFGVLHPVARIYQDYEKNRPLKQLFKVFILYFCRYTFRPSGLESREYGRSDPSS